MMTFEATIDRYCEAWSAADPNRRFSLLADVWSDGGIYCDPTVHAVGASALLDHIAAVIARRPGSRVLRTSALDRHHDLARFTWAAVAEDGAVLRDGIDIATFDASGRITRMIGFFGSPEPLR
ncbi:MAG: hypothetical protein CMM50_10270 [Rhodospirillaceae bacterium]|nr:hypothetical protein [Rhodospirillaceae bacterium]